MIIIGIDPGQSGGVAIINTQTDFTPRANKMPATVHDIVELLYAMRDEHEQAKCYIEKVASSPQMGVTSAFTFGNGLGRLEGILAALNIPMEYVTPQKWQKAMQCMTKGDKNVSKSKAQQLWPTIKWTHATADAALICEYGRRLEAK
jgi:crossover junction endodeoxyribonuclease RuvC